MTCISVIITAYDREDYLMKAVSSVLGQTFSREEYEIIVVKNFQNKAIDEFLDDNKVKRILEPSPFWNISLSRAVEEAQGNVISFLDDDDYFSPIKLEFLYNLFMKEDIVFCKDGAVPVDENGKTLGNYKDRRQNRSYFYISDDGTFVGDRGYLSLFNSSSMSMLKSSLKEHLSKLNKLLEESDGCRFAMDNFICLASLESGKCLVIPEKLTFYRQHGKQLTVNEKSSVEFNRKKLEMERLYGQSYSSLKLAFTSEFILQKLTDMEFQAELQTSILSFRESGFSLSLVLRAIRNYSKSRENYVLVLLALYLLAKISSNWSSLLYKRLMLGVARKLN